MIQGVKIKKLQFCLDERGRLLEILRLDDAIFKKFGQVYITTISPGVIKGWHFHEKQTDTVCCIKGSIKLVVYDRRKNSKTYKKIEEFFFGDYHPMLVQIPPLVCHAIKCIGEDEAILINIPDKLYKHKSPDEYRIKLSKGGINYNWEEING